MTPTDVFSILFVALLVASGLFYAGLVLRMFFAFGKMKAGNATFEKLPSVSILVSARNEEANVENLLNSLLAQDYEGEWDIWIADDRSTDGTLAALENFAKSHPRVHVLPITELPPKTSPKKQAITKLVASSKGELLLLTDADCRIPPTWVSHMVKEFEPGIDLVAGNSYLEIKPGKDSTLLYMQAVETMSYRIAGTAGLALQMPLTSTGNNLAYRRSFFESVHGFEKVEHIQSGDDDLLMQKAANNPSCMGYSIAEETFIATDGKETLKGLWEQRKRWASKTIHYTPRTLRILASIFTFFLCLTVAPFLAFVNEGIAIAAITMFLIKIVADLMLFKRGLRVFKQEHLFKWFIPVEILHAPFTVLAVLFGVLGKFQWKN